MFALQNLRSFQTIRLLPVKTIILYNNQTEKWVSELPSYIKAFSHNQGTKVELIIFGK